MINTPKPGQQGFQKTHGDRKKREYSIWNNMRRRCYENTAISYKNYGGRGIAVCSGWRSSYEQFISDMGYAPTNKHTLDRINSDGHYEPGNCRWATRKEQAQSNRGNFQKGVHPWNRGVSGYLLGPYKTKNHTRKYQDDGDGK